MLMIQLFQSVKKCYVANKNILLYKIIILLVEAETIRTPTHMP